MRNSVVYPRSGAPSGSRPAVTPRYDSREGPVFRIPCSRPRGTIQICPARIGRGGPSGRTSLELTLIFDFPPNPTLPAGEGVLLTPAGRYSQ